jgi:ribosome-associated protein
MTRKRQLDNRDLKLACETLDANKAIDVTVLDLRSLSDATDYFLIASGTSDTHVRALADRIIEAFTTAKRKPHHVEGLSAGRWVLIDFVDFVVHVFHPTLRDFYQLERLWADAPLLSVGSGG